MKLGTKLVVGSLTGTLAFAAATGAIAVSNAADSSTTSSSSPTKADGLAKHIADDFDLQTDDVQKSIDEFRDTQRETMLKNRLDKAVDNGTITSAQETLIINKLKDVEANRPNLKNMTVAERRAALKKLRTDLKKWADDNDIPLRELMPFRGPGGPGGFGRHHMGVRPGGFMAPPAEADNNASAS